VRLDSRVAAALGTRHPEPALLAARLQDLRDLGYTTVATGLERAEKEGILADKLREYMLSTANINVAAICGDLLDDLAS
jgi:hypothetical protein